MQTESKLSTDTEKVRSYAIRRVNPFLGVLQIIETVGGRAVSANGVVWDIEVLVQQSGEWGSLNKNSSQAAYYRYGLWSEQEGLVNRPLAPHLESDPLTKQCHTIIDCIRERLGELPFTIHDNNELWLFDKDDKQPLALLATATADGRRPSPEPRYWACCIGADGVPSQCRFPRSDELVALVKQRAGFNVQKHWVVRQDDGSGVIENSSIRLRVQDFPVFLLTEDWPVAEQSKLVREYVEWITPALLTLQYLSKRERERLEECLNVQAVSVEHHWHLYPEILDQQHLSAARVQSRLQKANK